MYAEVGATVISWITLIKKLRRYGRGSIYVTALIKEGARNEILGGGAGIKCRGENFSLQFLPATP